MILTSCSTRSDGSLALRFASPELEPAEKTAFFELLNTNVKVLIQPSDAEPVELKEVKGQFDRKTASQRLRSVLFILWKQADGTGDFEEFYRRRMEDIINTVKNKLEQKP